MSIISQLPETHIHPSYRGRKGEFFPKWIAINLQKEIDEIPLKDIHPDENILRKALLKAISNPSYRGSPINNPYCIQHEADWNDIGLSSDEQRSQKIFHVPKSMGVALVFPLFSVGVQMDQEPDEGLRYLTVKEPVEMIIKKDGVDSGLINLNGNLILTSGVVEDNANIEKPGRRIVYFARKLMKLDPKAEMELKKLTPEIKT